MNDYIEDFIMYIRKERNYSTHTETNYLLDIEKFEIYLKENHLNYKNLRYKDISTYVKYLKEKRELSLTSINRHLSALRSFYNYLLKENVINFNPFKLVVGPKKEKKLPNYMKYSEFEELVNSCDDSALGIRNRALVELLFATGARISEIINIKVLDIDFSRREIKVLGKGNKERICYFNSFSEKYLIKYLEEARKELLKNKKSDRLFINHLGGNLTDRGVRTILDKMIQQSCLNSHITPHTFRHTFATMLLNEGCDLKSVQELLGHVNLNTTSIYTHLSNDRIKDIYLHSHPRSKK